MNFKVIKESHYTNYGHEELIIKGNVVFPPRNELVKNIETSQVYGYQNNSQDNFRAYNRGRSRGRRDYNERGN